MEYTGFVLENGILVPRSVTEGPEGIQMHDAESASRWISPMHVDQHTHGYDGEDTLVTSSQQHQRMAASLMATGVGWYTPALLAAPKQTLQGAQMALIRSGCFSIFSEGTFGSPSKRGCQDAANMVPLSIEALTAYFSTSIVDEVPLRVMFAPEIVDDPQKILEISHNCWPLVSYALGHTNASLEQAVDTLRYGAGGFVHFGNAMRGGIDHRKPLDWGTIEGLASLPDSELSIKDLPIKYDHDKLFAAIGRKDYYLEVICDGIHLHPEFVLYLIRQFGPEHIIPVTDQLPGAGLDVGYRYQIGDEFAVITTPQEAGYDYHGAPELDMRVCMLENSKALAGSAATYPQLLRNLYYWLTTYDQNGFEPYEPHEAQRMVAVMATNPHRLHGVGTDIARPGFVVYSPDLATYEVVSL